MVFATQVIQDGFPRFPYEEKIEGGNVDTIEDADLVFILDEHKNASHEAFFADIIAHFADKSVDIALVEESKALLGESLYERLQARSPIKAVALSAMQTFGWDHVQREMWLASHKEEIRKIQEAALILSDGALAAPHEKIQAFAKLAACHNALLPDDRIDPKKHLDEIIRGNQSGAASALLPKLKEAGSTVIVLKQKDLVCRTFAVRQDSLEESIQTAASLLMRKPIATKARKKVFISLGIHHGSVQKNPFKDKVQPFLERIGAQFTYILLNPDKE